MLLKTALIFGILAVTVNVGFCQEDKKQPLKYKPFKPSSPLLEERAGGSEAQRRQLSFRPGQVVPASPAQEKPEEKRTSHFSVQSEPRSSSPDHEPNHQRPIPRPTRPQSEARRPQRPQRPQQFGNQEPSGFGPSLPPTGISPQSGAPRVPQSPPARPAVADFKPFDEPESNEKDDAPVAPPPRPARNPSQYGPRPVADESYQGFPSGFSEGLPKFNFQGKFPDAPAGESRGFLDGFNSFPDFRTVGGFEPLGVHDRQSGQGRGKRNPEEEPEARSERFTSERFPSGTREERYYDILQRDRVKRDVHPVAKTPTPPIYSDYLLSPSSSVQKSKKRGNSTKRSKDKYSKFKVISSKIEVDSEILTKAQSDTKPKNITRHVQGLNKAKKPASDEAFLDDEVNDEFLLSDDFFKNSSESLDNKVSEQRLFPRRNTRQGSEFPSFDIFRPFFDDFISRPERPSSPPPQRRQRPRPRPSNDQRFDGSDNSLLGSGNFLVLPGGTFKDYSDYHDYYVNNRYKPYRPEYNDDFFSNFKDFADINANRRQSSGHRDTY